MRRKQCQASRLGSIDESCLRKLERVGGEVGVILKVTDAGESTSLIVRAYQFLIRCYHDVKSRMSHHVSRDISCETTSPDAEKNI